jgi:hypothetical protein
MSSQSQGVIMIAIIRARLVRLAFLLHLKTFPIEQIYGEYLTGDIPADAVYAWLRLKQIDDFINLHERIKRAVDNGFEAADDDIPLAMFAYLVGTLQNHPHRLHFALQQLDRIIEADLEKQIYRRLGKKNIIRREI